MGKWKIDCLPMALAGAAFALLVAASAVNLRAYRRAIIESAARDLGARAEVAARYLEEPLRTLDFARVRRFGDECRARGYELSVVSAAGGHLFDTLEIGREGEWLGASAVCGENRVVLRRPASETLAPFRRALGVFALAAVLGASGMFVVFFITYRQRVRIRELKRLEKFRRDFIADVSHEIKTPLTGILGAVEMLEEGDEKGGGGDGGGERGVLLGLIRKESTRLNALVQSILDLARLEREGEVLNRVETDLVELTGEIAARHGVKTTAVGRVVVDCDQQQIERAVENLVVNAVRHSGSDEIAVSVSADASAARIAVEDHGVGIPPEHAARIFERFYRVDPARAAETGGAGLGLAIVRRIARLHGGDVAYSPVVPRGSRFTLTIRRVGLHFKRANPGPVTRPLEMSDRKLV